MKKYFLFCTITFFLFNGCVKEHDTCYDSRQNNGEEGVDCGGPCKFDCNSQTPPPPPPSTSIYSNAPCSSVLLLNTLQIISPYSSQSLTSSSNTTSGSNYLYQRYNSSGSRIEVSFFGAAPVITRTYSTTGSSAHPTNTSTVRLRIRWNNSASIYPAGTVYYKVESGGRYVSFCSLSGYRGLIRII